MHAPEPTVSARVVRLIAAAGRLAGADADAVLRALGLEERLAADAAARIPLSREDALRDAMAAAAADPLFGLGAVRAYEAPAYDVLDYAIRNSADVAAAIACAARYNPVFHDVARFGQDRAGPSGHRAVLRHWFDGRPSGAGLRAADFTVATVVGVLRGLTGGAFLPLEVRFQLGAPADEATRASHRAALGAPNAFGHECNAVVFDASALALPLTSADPALHAVLRRHADATMERLPELHGFAERVRAELAHALRGGDPGTDSIAAGLLVSRRTLQRRLGEAGTTFQDLLETLRREMVTRYLADDGVAIAEVAYLLGYSEPGAFHRAFRRWTGQTPAAWRAARRDPGGG